MSDSQEDPIEAIEVLKSLLILSVKNHAHLVTLSRRIADLQAHLGVELEEDADARQAVRRRVDQKIEALIGQLHGPEMELAKTLRRMNIDPPEDRDGNSPKGG